MEKWVTLGAFGNPNIIEYKTGIHILLGQNSNIEFINDLYEGNKYYHYFCKNDTCELTLVFEQENDDKVMPIAALNSKLIIPLNDAVFIVTHVTYTIVNEQPIQFKAYISTQNPEYRISGTNIKPTIVQVYDYKYNDNKLSELVVNRYEKDNKLLGTDKYKIYYYSD